MLKALLRFSLLLVLCTMLVFAPEILTGVSAPYAPKPAERVLLRIALCCDSDTSALLLKTINGYQKQYPSVHLRVTHISPDLLAHTAPPYPDVILCTGASIDCLPVGFSPAHPFPIGENSSLHCAVLSDSESHEAGSAFAAYIYETTAVQKSPSEI